MNYVRNFGENYTTSQYSGYQKVIDIGMKSNGINQVNATAFILRVLAENPSYTSTISGFEEKIESINDDGAQNRAYADIIFNDNKIIECKSWALNGLAFQHFVAGNSSSVQQFITYLSDQNRVTSMNQLEYWFDKLKLGGSTDATPVKQKFQEMMLQNDALTQRGTDVFNAIWGNSGLRESLFPRATYNPLFTPQQYENAAKVYFTSSLGDITYNFYSFITVK